MFQDCFCLHIMAHAHRTSRDEVPLPSRSAYRRSSKSILVPSFALIEKLLVRGKGSRLQAFAGQRALNAEMQKVQVQKGSRRRS